MQLNFRNYIMWIIKLRAIQLYAWLWNHIHCPFQNTQLKKNEVGWEYLKESISKFSDIRKNLNWIKKCYFILPKHGFTHPPYTEQLKSMPVVFHHRLEILKHLDLSPRAMIWRLWIVYCRLPTSRHWLPVMISPLPSAACGDATSRGSLPSLFTSHKLCILTRDPTMVRAYKL